MKISYVQAVTLYERGYKIREITKGLTFTKVSKGCKVAQDKPFLFYTFPNKAIRDFIDCNGEFEVIEPN